MILFGFFMLVAAYLIIWGRIPVGWVRDGSVRGHPVLVRVAGAGILALVLFARYTNGSPTLLVLYGVGLFFLLVLAIVFGN